MFFEVEDHEFPEQLPGMLAKRAGVLSALPFGIHREILKRSGLERDVWKVWSPPQAGDTQMLD